jgi:hypothetical protein
MIQILHAARPWQALDACEHLLAAHLSEAVQRFGAGALGLVDLPPITSSSLSPAQLRVAAVLFWAREVEGAGLLPFVEALAEQVVEGRLALPLTDGADRLVRYWRARDERYGAPERAALYARVFDAEAEDELARLVDGLAEIGRVGRGQSTNAFVARVNVVARELGATLSARCAGMAAYAARDIVQHVRTALALLGTPDVTQALGGGGPWTMLRLHAPVVLGHEVEPEPHLSRARDGQTILSWIADQARSLESGAARIVPGDAVVSAALAWQAEGGAPGMAGMAGVPHGALPAEVARA